MCVRNEFWIIDCNVSFVRSHYGISRNIRSFSDVVEANASYLWVLFNLYFNDPTCHVCSIDERRYLNNICVNTGGTCINLVVYDSWTHSNKGG